MPTIKTTGNGTVQLLAGGGKCFTDIAARFCHSNKSIADICDTPYTAGIVQNILQSGHLAATEFDYYVFAIEGYSRVTEVQLVRKRLASYMISSGRDERDGKREFSVVLSKRVQDFKPTLQIEDEGRWFSAKVDALYLLELTKQWYEAGVESGLPEEDLRSMKPQGTEFKAIIGMNAHALLDWFGIRCCFDKDTEVLTCEGWKFFKDLRGDELFYSMDKKTRNAEYVKSKELIVQDFSGEMVHVKSKRIDLCTTQNHNNLVSIYPFQGSTRKDAKEIQLKKKQLPLSFVKAEEMENSGIVKMTRTCNSVISENEEKEIFFEEVNTKKDGKGKLHNGFYAKTSDLLRIAGFYISDGNLICKKSKKTGEKTVKGVSFSKGSYEKCIKYAEKISKMISKEVKTYKVSKNCCVINVFCPQLYDFLKQFGEGAKNKHIPEHIFRYDQQSLCGLLKGLLDGDAHICEDGHGSYTTVSKKLADDFQRLLLHCGLSGSIKKRKNDHVSIIKGINNEGKTIKGKNDIYTISFSINKIDSEFVKDYKRSNIKKVPYTGKVYCVELEKNNTLYVRRNGTPVWSGNCLNAQHEIRDLANKMLALCREASPDLFAHAGPHCVNLGYCPENARQNKKCVGKIIQKNDALRILKEHSCK